MASRLPSYNEIANALQQVESDMEASEIHATLCGLSCTENRVEMANWFSTCGLNIDNANLLHVEALTLFEELYQVTREQINDSNCDYHLLLPEDESGLDEQVTALGDWCQGFLLGLSAGGIADFSKHPADVAEVLRDLTQIGAAGVSYDLDGSEDDEKAYEEIVEYVRVGVLLVNEELNPIEPTMPQSSHH